MMDERELAIRRNQTHKMLEWVESRLKFIERDIRRAANDMDRKRLEEVHREVDRWRSRLRVEIVSLRGKCDVVEGAV